MPHIEKHRIFETFLIFLSVFQKESHKKNGKNTKAKIEILNPATLFQKKQFKELSNNILPNALSYQKIHLT